jgi:large subunit ribosomal protein L5
MKDTYRNTVVPALKKELSLSSVMAVPKLEKITLNVGVGSYTRSGSKDIEPVISNIAQLTGQKPIVTKARIAVSNFRLRIGQDVGVVTTLRGDRMYDFVGRLVHIVLPRIRDFRGITAKGFDGNGNYTLGVKEVTVFPEVDPNNINKNHGLQITINTTADNDEDAYKLLKAMGLPFRDEVKSKKKAAASH